MRKSGDLCTNLQSTLCGCKLAKGVCHSWEWHSLSWLTCEWQQSTVLPGEMCPTAGTQPVASWSQARYPTGRDSTITHTLVNHNKTIQDFHFYIYHSCSKACKPMGLFCGVHWVWIKSPILNCSVRNKCNQWPLKRADTWLKIKNMMHLSYILINSYGAFHMLAF